MQELFRCHPVFFWVAWLPVCWRSRLLERSIVEEQDEHWSSAVAERCTVMRIGVAGALLLLGNVVAGFSHTLESWPLSCMPTFDYLIQSNETVSLAVFHQSGSSDWERIDNQPMIDRYGSALAARMTEAVLKPQAGEKRILAVQLYWARLISVSPSFREADEVQFRAERIFLDPDRTSENPRQSAVILQATAKRLNQSINVRDWHKKNSVAVKCRG
ncbi:hypothetical protein SH139x_003069 [Planctomycetaceae bacterium SH139]